MLRVVLDTNVIISGTIRRAGPSGTILRAWRKGQFLLVTSEKLIEEAQRVFAYPRIAEYGIPSFQIERVLSALRTYGIITQGKVTVEVIEEDPADDLVLGAAVEGGADYIISGDQHLKKLRRYRDIIIVTPHEFLALIKKKRSD